MGSKGMRIVALVIVALLACMSSIAATGTEQKITLTIPGSGGVQIIMELIPAGTFYMGSPESEKDRLFNEGPQHDVTITEPFYMGVYEITQEQWYAVMGNNPSYFKAAGNPVERVSWDDCQEFIVRINTMGIGTYRLPTEAEWEYACTARSSTRFPWWDDPDYIMIDQYAWYGDNSEGKTHPVGEKKPNLWDLYDMAGNVWEWCSDWYGTYSPNTQTDPTGPSRGSYRVVRGGSWLNDPQYCRSADRGGSTPADSSSSLGFRLVRRTF